MADLSYNEIINRIPEDLLYEITDLLRSPGGNSAYTMIVEIYERKLRGLLLRVDCEAQVQEIDAVVNQSTYQTSEGTMRILSVLFGDKGLYKTSSAARDLLHPNWQTNSDGTPVSSGTPEVWWNEQVDPAVDAEARIRAEHFMVRPAPATVPDGTKFNTYTAVLPEGGALDADFLNPILVYESVAQSLMDMWWEKGADERQQENADISEFFKGLAALWEEVIKNRTLL